MSTYKVSCGTKSVCVMSYDAESARAIGTVFLLLEYPTIVGSRPMNDPIAVEIATYDEVALSQAIGRAKIITVASLETLSKHLRNSAEIDSKTNVFQSLMREV